MLASGSWDGTIRFWDKQGNYLKILEGSTIKPNWVNALIVFEEMLVMTKRSNFGHTDDN